MRCSACEEYDSCGKKQEPPVQVSTELVSDALASRKQKEAATNAKIVDLFKEALDEIRNCRTEQQRVEFHIALACVMPPREAQGSKNGWIKPICDRLGLKRGKRSEKNGAKRMVP